MLKQEEIIKRNKDAQHSNPRKGKDMTTVRLAYGLNDERYYESFVMYERTEWSGFMRSFKIRQRQRQRITV